MSTIVSLPCMYVKQLYRSKKRKPWNDGKLCVNKQTNHCKLLDSNDEHKLLDSRYLKPHEMKGIIDTSGVGRCDIEIDFEGYVVTVLDDDIASTSETTTVSSSSSSRSSSSSSRSSSSVSNSIDHSTKPVVKFAKTAFKIPGTVVPKQSDNSSSSSSRPASNSSMINLAVSKGVYKVDVQELDDIWGDEPTGICNDADRSNTGYNDDGDGDGDDDDEDVDRYILECQQQQQQVDNNNNTSTYHTHNHNCSDDDDNGQYAYQPKADPLIDIWSESDFSTTTITTTRVANTSNTLDQSFYDF